VQATGSEALGALTWALPELIEAAARCEEHDLAETLGHRRTYLTEEIRERLADFQA